MCWPTHKTDAILCKGFERNQPANVFPFWIHLPKWQLWPYLAVLTQISGQATQCDKKITQEKFHHLCGPKCCNQSFLLCRSLFRLSLLSNGKMRYCGLFHQDIKGFPLRGGESRKDKWKISRVWNSLSDNPGLCPYYCFPFSRGEILHRGWVLTVIPKPLLSTAGQLCRTDRDCCGFPELFKIQGEW